jgi:UDP-2,3-diacylglucosamine hydrolase
LAAAQAKQRVYIASDVHLGIPDAEQSLDRERKLIRWLDSARADAQEIILLGDLFDFWFEYKHAIPKGYPRLLGKLAELADSGLPLTLFSGNHDMWYGDYFPRYLGIPVHTDPVIREFFGYRCYLAHGDGLGPGDQGYKLLKWGMRSRLLRWCFRWIHPDWGIPLANYFSGSSRNHQLKHQDVDHGEREFLYQFVQQYVAAQDDIDYFIFGHRHFEKRQAMSQRAEMIVLGDWIADFSYLTIEPEGLSLHRFEG